jgi:glucose-1-phosphate adenylyltransferase
MMQIRVLAVVLAGGKGTRLYPLTRERAKSAVPFGGRHLLIDIVLSNLVNSGIRSIYVLVQFGSQPLLEHLSRVWRIDESRRGDFVIPVPAQMRSHDESWYMGTADAILQNVNLIEQTYPDVVAILSADHVGRMDVRRMVQHHVEAKADITVAAVPVGKASGCELGVIDTSSDGVVLAFHAKNTEASAAHQSAHLHALMPTYLFSMNTLLRALYEDSVDEKSHHDLARDILPKVALNNRIHVYDLDRNRVPGEPVDLAPYWRDVGTINSYYEAHMELCGDRPKFNLFDIEWPIRGGFQEVNCSRDRRWRENASESGPTGTAIEGQVTSAVISPGCRIAGAVRNSVLSPGVEVRAEAIVEDSVILENCQIGRGARIRRAILDSNFHMPEGATIGIDLESDKERYMVTESGIVVVMGERRPLDVGSIIV